MRSTKASLLLGSIGAVLTGLLVTTSAFAAISFVSATNSASLVNTVDVGGQRIFVIGGLADGDSSVLTLSTDSDCPGVAMTGGAEFTADWSCVGGAISATVTYRGGMSFGPAQEGSQGTFYVSFNNPPTPPGMDSPPAALSGIQISVFGDVDSWGMSGDMSSDGVKFGVELSGPSGGAAHFRLDLPQPAVQFLGGVLGVFVGGKADPFATVTTNNDGSASIVVDITTLSSASAAKLGVKTSTVTKKITAGARSLSLGFNKAAIKTGKSITMAMCAGTTFTAGDKVPVAFTVGGKAAGIKKTLTLDSHGCARAALKLKSVKVGTLTAKISYKGARAKTSIKVSK